MEGAVRVGKEQGRECTLIIVISNHPDSKCWIFSLSHYSFTETNTIPIISTLQVRKMETNFSMTLVSTVLAHSDHTVLPHSLMSTFILFFIAVFASIFGTVVGREDQWLLNRIRGEGHVFGGNSKSLRYH